MTKQAEQTEQTEVVKIRLGTKEKARLAEIASSEHRTLAGQIRHAIREWLSEMDW
jgi:predicted DNA-binding protein